MRHNMNQTIKRALAAIAGAVTAVSAAGVLPVSAEIRTLYPEQAPDTAAMTLLGESALKDGMFPDIEVPFVDPAAYDTFYVTANASCAADLIQITVLQEGYSAQLEDYFEISRAKASALIALGDAAYQFKPEPLSGELEFVFQRLTVTASVMEPLTQTHADQKLRRSENPELTIRLYGTKEEQASVQTEESTVLSQACFAMKSVPDLSMVAHGDFRYTALSVDAGKEFDPADMKLWLETRSTAFTHETREPVSGGPTQITLRSASSQSVKPVEAQWQDGAFRTVPDADTELSIPQKAKLLLRVADDSAVPAGNAMFRIRLNGCAIVDDAYDCFRISVKSQSQGDVRVKYAVLNPADAAQAIIAEDTCQIPLDNQAAQIRLNAPEGSVIVIESVETVTNADDNPPAAVPFSGEVQIEGVKMLTGSKDAVPLMGDVNNDAKVDVSDAVLLARYIAEDHEAVMDEAGKINADCDHSGKPDSADVILILRYIAHLIPSLD